MYTYSVCVKIMLHLGGGGVDKRIACFHVEFCAINGLCLLGSNWPNHSSKPTFPIFVNPHAHYGWELIFMETITVWNPGGLSGYWLLCPIFCPFSKFVACMLRGTISPYPTSSIIRKKNWLFTSVRVETIHLMLELVTRRNF